MPRKSFAKRSAKRMSSSVYEAERPPERKVFIIKITPDEIVRDDSTPNPVPPVVKEEQVEQKPEIESYGLCYEDIANDDISYPEVVTYEGFVNNDIAYEDIADDDEGYDIAPSTKGTNTKSSWSRHKVKFSEDWLTEFPFLEYDRENNLMYCRECRKYVNDWRKFTPFVAGTNNFRLSILNYHENSSMHKESMRVADAVSSECNESEQQSSDLYKEQLANSLKSVYFIYKTKSPYTHFPQLCASQKRDGADLIVYSTHIKVVPLFGKFIGMAFEKELATYIANFEMFSLVLDASFRRNIESHELVYLKYLDGIAVKTVFLGVIDSGAKLHGSMYNILSNLFKTYSISRWLDKVVYLMTDRHDNCLWYEGFIELIKERAPENYVSEVRYLSHKVKFCHNVVQTHKSTNSLNVLIWSAFCSYEKVDKSKQNLLNMNRELERICETYGGLPKNSFTTLYFETLRAVFEDWQPLVQLLEKEQHLMHFDFKIRKTGARVLTGITRSSFICKMGILLDVFYCIGTFASKLGTEDLLPFEVYVMLEEVCADIEKASCGEGPTAVEISQELNFSKPYFRGVEIKMDCSMNHVVPDMQKFGADVITYLKSVTEEPLLRNTAVFNTSLWPEGEELQEFGNLEFQELFILCGGKEKHLECALSEWCTYKDEVAAFPAELKTDCKSVIEKVITEYTEIYPFITTMLKKILLLNFECSEIQRGYHEMCLNKSSERSMLSLQSLQTSMMISMYGPQIGDFDPVPAMELFLHSRHRRFRKKIIDKKTRGFSIDGDEDVSSSQTPEIAF